MTELSGTLDGLGLPAIVRFLMGLKKTGYLRLDQQDWHGEIVFVEGQVKGASLGSKTGLVAFDALVESLPAADFAFDSQLEPPTNLSIHLGDETFLAHLEELAARLTSGIRTLPAADSIP